MARLFDRYLAVDWSARSTPSPVQPHKDALWWAWATPDGALEIGYARTRHRCAATLLQLLRQWQADKLRVLAGFDFSFGYPAGFADAALSGTGPAWLRTWAYLAQHLRDSPRNTNNRFAVAAQLNARCGQAGPGPFWGCPPAQQGAVLSSKRHPEGYPYPLPKGSLARLRHTETEQPGVQSTWKLLGVGSVGSQSLTGIPVLYRLREALQPHLAIWPFETGLGPRPTTTAPLVLAEIWPSQVPLRPPEQPDEIHDRRQVRSTALHMVALDAQNALAERFCAPDHLLASQQAIICGEEGRILPLT